MILFLITHIKNNKITMLYEIFKKINEDKTSNEDIQGFSQRLFSNYKIIVNSDWKSLYYNSIRTFKHLNISFALYNMIVANLNKSFPVKNLMPYDYDLTKIVNNSNFKKIIQIDYKGKNSIIYTFKNDDEIYYIFHQSYNDLNFCFGGKDFLIKIIIAIETFKKLLKTDEYLKKITKNIDYGDSLDNLIYLNIEYFYVSILQCLKITSCKDEFISFLKNNGMYFVNYDVLLNCNSETTDKNLEESKNMSDVISNSNENNNC